MAANLLDRILLPQPPPFAILHRPETTGPEVIELLTGELSTPDSIAAIPLPEEKTGVLVLMPYRQLAERGFACVDDGAPLLALTVTGRETATRAEVLPRLPMVPITVTGRHFDVDDDEYAKLVSRVVADEIGTGVGANFVIKRSFLADITGYTVAHALAFFRRLLERETGAYWTFIVHTGERTFVGASPERQVSLRDGTAVMNPISGTFRYPPTGPTLPAVLDFLANQKETDELHMVLDEELKMMARICRGGGRVIGPFLKEMAHLAHTEYLIEGQSDRDPRDILRETMFAPTVTGSPLESACRVIREYEPHGRGYYSGVVALIGTGVADSPELDSAILIRTATIDHGGRLDIGVGATLVRHSDPRSEVAETRAKAAGLLAALGADERVRFRDDPRVRAALLRRTADIAEYWRAGGTRRAAADPELAGRKVLVVDAEDTFTSMLANQLSALGLEVTVRRFDEPYDVDGQQLVVLGPGPGDPRDLGHPKIAHLHAAVDHLLGAGRPFLAICLSHQVLSLRLGLPVERRPVPNQGTQRDIDLFGAPETVGFYNTFAARTPEDKLDLPGIGVVEVSRDERTGEVHALRGPGFASMQFHAESVLTKDGVRIVGTMTKGVLLG